MKVLNFLFAICLVSFMASCGGDSCEVADWTGTYTLDTEASVCDDLTDFETSVTITTGSAEGTIAIDGDDITINTESCTFSYDGATAELDGDDLRVVVEGCTLVYN